MLQSCFILYDNSHIWQKKKKYKYKRYVRVKLLRKQVSIFTAHGHLLIKSAELV